MSDNNEGEHSDSENTSTAGEIVTNESKNQASGEDDDQPRANAEAGEAGNSNSNSAAAMASVPAVRVTSYQESLKGESSADFVDDATKEMILYMLRYSFSKSLNANTFWLNLIFRSFNHIVDYISTKPSEKIYMRSILKHMSPIVGQHLITINRKKEELLSFEAVVVLAFMKSDYCKTLYLDINDFLEKYPQFKSTDISEEERTKLHEFGNCVRIVQCLIPAKNNKEHVLDLVSRLTEGFSVRRVTGTGMTIETRNRYEIIHREGGLIPQPRVEKRPLDSILGAEGEAKAEQKTAVEGEIAAEGGDNGASESTEIDQGSRATVLPGQTVLPPPRKQGSNKKARGRPRSMRTDDLEDAAASVSAAQAQAQAQSQSQPQQGQNQSNSQSQGQGQAQASAAVPTEVEAQAQSAEPSAVAAAAVAATPASAPAQGQAQPQAQGKTGEDKLLLLLKAGLN